MKRLTICLIGLALVAMLCASGTVLAETPKQGGTAYVAVLADSWSLDPIHIQTTTGERIVHDGGIGECLYDWSVEKAEFEPRLATALPEISADGKSYTIKLRQGVKYHDGTPFNAEAMAYS